MLTGWQSFSIRAKLTLFGAGAVAATSLLLVLTGLWHVGQLTEAARQEVDGLIAADLDHMTRGVYNLIEAQDEALRQQVTASLRVAESILEREGGLRFASATAEWETVNQFSQMGETVALPRAVVGGRVLEPNDGPNAVVPVVDEVTRLVGGTATLFQRMNARGDMLRVATTAQTVDGRRAIGTFIPVVNPDGTPNPVMAQVLKGDVYHGVAYVVDAWYLTAYQPIRDAGGAVAGMLSVGLPYDDTQASRRALYNTRVGTTGYVYILGGQGDDRGHYIVSRNGERDGEDLWETRDADGQFIIQEIVNQAVALGPGELATVRYRWQNAGEAAPRWKVAHLAYYAPYDWVIGVGAYEDELSLLQTRLAGRQRDMSLAYLGVGLGLALLGALLAVFIARGLARPLTEMVAAAEALSAGDLTREVGYHGGDEVGRLAHAFRQMTAHFRRLTGQAERIAAGDLAVQQVARSAQDELGQTFDRMTGNLRRLVEQAGESAGAVLAASAQLTAAAGQAQQATEQIATAMQQVARGTAQQSESVTRTATSMEQMKRAIDGVARGAQEQAAAVGKVSTLTSEMTAAIQQVAGNAAAVTQESAGAAEAARAGSRTVEETIKGMSSIRAKVGVSADKVQEMGRRSDQIGTIVEAIDDIASQTNLLALNAAIEAARAGEHGKGFAVVADEVRKLAERASAATKEIGGLIKGIQATVGDAVQAMADGAREVETGSQLANEASEALARIMRAAEAVQTQAEAARNATQRMSGLSDELVSAMDSMSAVVEENTAATEEMAARAGEVAGAIENIASVSEENSAAVEEVSASAEEMNAQVEEVTASAQSLAEMARALQDVVAQFRLGADSQPGAAVQIVAPARVAANSRPTNGHRVEKLSFN